MRTYCTYFDRGYLSRGIAMIDSLLDHDPHSNVWVLALSDDICPTIQDRYQGRVTVVPLPQFEEATAGISQFRNTRSRTEYIFTLTASWTRFVMDQTNEKNSWVTYLDADLWFFNSVDPIYEEIEDGSVAVVEHRYPRTRRSLNRFGTYNVGWVSFRNDDDGRSCLRWWDERCREWCFDRCEDGKFADQGYLDYFGQVTHRLVVIENSGVDLAPWNLGRHRISGRRGDPKADGQSVICFHFHGVRRSGDRYFWKNAYYHARTTKAVRELLFRPYLSALFALDLSLDTAPADPRTREWKSGVTARRRETLKLAIAWIAGDTLRVAPPRGSGHSLERT